MTGRRFVPLVTIGLCIACAALAIRANDPGSRLSALIDAWRARPASDAAAPWSWPLAALLALVHVKPSHAVSNIALLVWFGTLAERRVGHATWFVFAILAGTLTTLAELAITGHGKIGASGTVFAAGALVLATWRGEPALPRRAVVIVGVAVMVAFAYGLAVSEPSNPTGIVAHTTGLVVGGAYGVFRGRRVRYA